MRMELRLYRNTTSNSTVTSYGVLAPSTAANARREPLFSVLGANTCSTLVIFRLPRFRMAPVGPQVCFPLMCPCTVAHVGGAKVSFSQPPPATIREDGSQ